MRKTNIAALAIVIVSFLIGAYLYHVLPGMLPSHWNAEGNVNGYSPKWFALFLVPIISLALLALFIAIPRIDPLKRNIESFRKYYDGFMLVMIIFLFYLHMLTIARSMGLTFNMMFMLAPAFGLLFYYCGVLMQHARQNWFIGIRTPWTLSSENVWNKTHSRAGTLFKISGIIAVIGIFFGKYAIWLVVGPVLIIAIYLVVYSYVLYKDETKKKLGKKNR